MNTGDSRATAWASTDATACHLGRSVYVQPRFSRSWRPLQAQRFAQGASIERPDDEAFLSV
jgi:hypothetical protein